MTIFDLQKRVAFITGGNGGGGVGMAKGLAAAGAAGGIAGGNKTKAQAAFLGSQAAYPHMVRAGGGKIINIGSMMSVFASSYATPYAASKGGIVQMARAMAVAWAKDNIQVNTILPGWVDTDLTRKAREEVDGLHEKVLARTPARRWGKPDDFAGIAVFLAAPASNFITGAAIAVDGGYSVQA